jgi:hypothetical protein
LEAATKKLGLSGPDRLNALETGEREPSRAQLAKMSEKYHRPLLAFYLPDPPAKMIGAMTSGLYPQGRPIKLPRPSSTYSSGTFRRANNS